MARKTKAEALETREKILAAALDVFSEKGYSSSTCVDIAKRIKATRGAVYWHFNNKQDLLVELINTMVVKEIQLLKEQMPQELTLDNLADYFVARARIVTQNEECRKFVFFITLQMEWTVETLTFTKQKLKQLNIGIFDEILTVLRKAESEGQLRKNVDIHQISDILIGMWKGLIKIHLGGFSSGELIQSVKTGFQAVIDSVKA